jgi:hypothetical protein
MFGDVLFARENAVLWFLMRVRVKVPQGHAALEGFLIGISSDRGNTWTFIDGAGVTKEQLARVVPDFPTQLSLPNYEQAILEPK